MQPTAQASLFSSIVWSSCSQTMYPLNHHFTCACQTFTLSGLHISGGFMSALKYQNWPNLCRVRCGFGCNWNHIVCHCFTIRLSLHSLHHKPQSMVWNLINLPAITTSPCISLSPPVAIIIYWFSNPHTFSFAFPYTPLIVLPVTQLLLISSTTWGYPSGILGLPPIVPWPNRNQFT